MTLTNRPDYVGKLSPRARRRWLSDRALQRKARALGLPDWSGVRG